MTFIAPPIEQDQMSSGVTFDRRRARRFQLHMPILAQWKSDEGTVHGAGFSRDISDRGVFVISSTPPPEATKISVDVLLPSVAASQELHLRCEGLVVRVEEGRGLMGYAVYCDFRSIEYFH
jgi:hypothetical protein